VGSLAVSPLPVDPPLFCALRVVSFVKSSYSLSSTSNICTGWLGIMVEIACL
jgi:hypothetical protein